MRAFASRRQKRAGRPSCARKNKKRFRRSSARDRLGARRAASDRAIVRARPPRRRRSRDTRRGAGRARGGPPRPVARDVGSGGLDAPSCVLCHAGASYLFAVTPPWRASALPAATPRVASANAAIPRLRTDLDAIATVGRARTATEARRAMRAAPSRGAAKISRLFASFVLKSAPGVPCPGGSADVGSRIRNAARGKPEVKATEPREARQKNKLSRHGASTRFARARVHRSPWRRASRHSRKVTRQPRRSPRSTNARLAPRSRFPRFVREPSSSAVPATLPRATA